MKIQNDKSSDSCSGIVEFLDGEISFAEKRKFEGHLPGCEECRIETELHRRLVDEIEEVPNDILLPADFSKIVAAKAESQVSGLREQKERKAAVSITAALTLLASAAIGLNLDSAIGLISTIAERVIALLTLIAGLLFNLLLGVYVIAKVAVTHFEMNLANLIGIVGIFVGILLLVLLIRNARGSVLNDAKR